MKLVQAALVFAALNLGWPGTVGAQEVDLDFFSLTPPASWQVGSDSYSIRASRYGGETPPFLMVQSCRKGGLPKCPARCDLDAIRDAGLLSKTAGLPQHVARPDGYVEYAMSQKDDAREGPVYTSVRVICSPQGIIFAALIGIESEERTDSALDAVVRSIKWKAEQSPRAPPSAAKH
jgi:hypothetical protein